MARRTARRKRLTIVTLCVCALVLGWTSRTWHVSRTTAPSTPPSVQPRKIELPVSPAPVVDFDRLARDEALTVLMQRRKASYGIDRSLDAIVTPGESIRVGDLTVPMEEILDKIRLQRGEIVEKPLTVAPLPSEAGGRRPSADATARLEARLAELEALLNDPETVRQRESAARRIAELERLERELAQWRAYREGLIDRRALQRRLPSVSGKRRTLLQERLARLNAEIARLEAQLGVTSARPLDDTRQAAAMQRLNDAITALQQDLNAPAALQHRQTDRRRRRERDRLTETLRVTRRHQRAVARLEAHARLLPAAGGAAREQLLDKIRLLEGERSRLADELAERRREAGRLAAYGIYVVRPGDNLWNIHFNFLREYLGHRRITLSPLADEPLPRGTSSGIGKLLKFSERMVHIYNLEDRRLDPDLDQLSPATKIVIFNMAQVFDLLDQIDYSRVNHIVFDGDTLWIPSQP